MALLLDGSRLRVALDYDQTAQRSAVFAGDFLPRRLALVLAERDDPVLFLRSQKNAPTIIRHFDVVELGPAARIDRIGGAQIDQRFLEAFRPHVVPPADVARVPALQRLEHAAVLGEPDIVRDLGGVIDVEAWRVHSLAPVSFTGHSGTPHSGGPRIHNHGGGLMDSGLATASRP